MADTSAQSPDRLTLANHLLDVMGFDTQMGRLRPDYSGDEPPVMKTAAGKALREFQAKYVTPAVLRPVFAAAYAERFTDDQLRQLIAFYESPVGRRFTVEQPKINAGGAEFARELVQKHSRR